MTKNAQGSGEEAPLPKLVEVLGRVDENKPGASANETSISDNNGGRIELGDNLKGSNVVKK
jgi:hypothetical protein